MPWKESNLGSLGAKGELKVASVNKNDDRMLGLQQEWDINSRLNEFVANLNK